VHWPCRARPSSTASLCSSARRRSRIWRRRDWPPRVATTLTLSAVVSCIGIGFQRGTHTRWQLVSNDASGAPTLVDMGASFAIATGGVLTLIIAAASNAGSVWVRVVDEVSGAIFEQEVIADLPAANQFLAPRLFMTKGPPPLPLPTIAPAVTSKSISGHALGERVGGIVDSVSLFT
jgi:hypothetical protein